MSRPAPLVASLRSSVRAALTSERRALSNLCQKKRSDFLISMLLAAGLYVIVTVVVLLGVPLSIARSAANAGPSVGPAFAGSLILGACAVALTTWVFSWFVATIGSWALGETLSPKGPLRSLLSSFRRVSTWTGGAALAVLFGSIASAAFIDLSPNSAEGTPPSGLFGSIQLWTVIVFATFMIILESVRVSHDRLARLPPLTRHAVSYVLPATISAILLGRGSTRIAQTNFLEQWLEPTLTDDAGTEYPRTQVIDEIMTQSPDFTAGAAWWAFALLALVRIIRAQAWRVFDPGTDTSSA